MWSSCLLHLINNMSEESDFVVTFFLKKESDNKNFSERGKTSFKVETKITHLV